MRLLRVHALVILVLAAAAGSAHAQALVAPVFEGFDAPGGFELAGWTVDPASTEGVGWNVDASPASVGGTPSTYSPGVPSLGSLNYNDGVNFEDITDGAVAGGALSPIIDVTAVSTPTCLISYKVMIDIEAGATSTVPTMAIEVYDATVFPATFVAALDIGRVGDGTSYELPQRQWLQLNPVRKEFAS